MKQEILSINNLQAHYGQQQVLKGIDFQLNSGQLVAITGASGIGKSSFIEAILGNLHGKMQLSVDQMFLLNQEWANLPIHKRQQYYRQEIGVIFQNVLASLDPVYTIRQQLKEIMIEASEARIEQLLTSVKLDTKILNCYPHELSGGMLQRVGFALALANRPSLVIADEAYNAMDVVLQREMMTMLKAYIATHSASAIVVTHNIALAQQFCDKIYTIVDGRLNSFQPNVVASKIMVEQLFLSTEPLFEIQQLCKQYENQIIALNQINLVLNERQFIGIVGQSGSGKTTLAKILAKLTSFDSGEIRYRGQVNSYPAKQEYYKEVQYIFQNSHESFAPYQTILESLEEPLRFLHGISAKKERIRQIEELFDWLSMDKAWLDKVPSQLSGGQCQRCAIVRALLAQPKCLICDEITSSLDIDNQRLMMRALKKIQQQKQMTIILISHQISLLQEYCNQFVVMKEGSIMDVFDNDGRANDTLSDYTKQLWKMGTMTTTK